MSSFNDYVVLRQTQIKRKQRLIAFVSTGLFLGSTAFAVGSFLTNTFREITQPKTNSTIVQSQPMLEEKGYELVLQREPKNQVALESLVQIRIKYGNLEGAQEPLESLVKLNPNNASYKALLTQVKKKVGDR